MPDGPIAKAYVEIRPDLTPFRDELRAGLDEQMDSLGARTVRIDADTLEADRKISDTATSVDELGAKTPSPTVHVNDTDAKAALDYMQARIDRLSSEAATVKIGTTGSARTGIGDIQSALDSFRNETLTPRVDLSRLEAMSGDLDTLETKLRNVDGDLGRVGRSAGGAESGVGGLAAAALTAAPALGTVGAVGVGALAGIATTAGAATLGLGAFALAAQGSLTQVKGEAQTMLTAWQQTQSAFTDPVIERAVGTLPALFGFLTPAVASTSNALLGLEGRIAASLGSPYLHSFSQFIAGEGGHAITAFGALIGGVGHTLSGFALGFAPELERLDADMIRWGQDGTKWGNELANGGMHSFLDYLRQNGPLVAHTLETFGGDIVTLAKDSAPLGPIYLNVLDAVAKVLGALEGFSPTLTAVVLGMAGAGLAVNRLLGPLGGLTGAAGKAKDALGAISASDMGLAGFGLAAVAIGAVTAAVVLMGDSIRDMAKKAQQGAQSSTEAFVQQSQQAGLSIGQIIDALHQQEQALFDNVAAHHGSVAVLQDEAAKAAALSAEVRNLQTQQAAETDAQNAANTAAGEGAGYTGYLALQYGQLSSQLRSANTALSQTETLLNNLLGTELSAAQNTTAFYQSVGNLTSSLQTNGTSLDGTTTKALANQQAFEGVGSSITSVIGSMEKQGSTSDEIVGKVQSLTGYIEAQAGKYGLTKAQVDQYLTSLGLTPAQVKTDLQLSGYDQASSKVQTLTNEINAIPKTATTILQIDRVFGGAGVSGSNAQIRAGAATGMSSAAGGLAMVAEQGPELMASKGSLTMFMTPQVADIPAGAKIFTASQTEKMASYADGVGNTAGAASIDGVTFNVPVKVPAPVTFAPTYLLQVDGAPSAQTLEQLKMILAAHDQEMIQTIGQLVGVAR